MKINNPLREALYAEGHTPTLNVVHLLDEPKKTAGIDLSQWHQAVSTVLNPEHVRFTELGEVSRSIVRHIPSMCIETLIRHGDSSRNAELRFARKILMIGRDGMRAATGGLLPERYTSLPRLTWSMGQLLDGDRSSEMKHAALDSFAALKKSGKSKFPKTGRNAQTRWSETLESIPDLLNTLATPDDHEPATYHNARKQFRLIVHTSIVHGLLRDDMPSRQLARSGLVLNEHIGAIKDALLADEPVA